MARSYRFDEDDDDTRERVRADRFRRDARKVAVRVDVSHVARTSRHESSRRVVGQRDSPRELDLSTTDG